MQQQITRNMETTTGVIASFTAHFRHSSMGSPKRLRRHALRRRKRHSGARCRVAGISPVLIWAVQRRASARCFPTLCAGASKKRQPLRLAAARVHQQLGMDPQVSGRPVMVLLWRPAMVL